MTKKNKFILGIAAVCVAGVLCGAILYFKADREAEPLFLVDGQPVYEEEFGFQIDEIRLPQRQELAGKAGIAAEEFRWDIEIDGKSGCAWAQDAALKRMVEIKVMQIEAKKNGVTDVIDYPSLMEQMEQENKKRRDSKENNGVVFGLTEYSPRIYYDYFNENLDIQNQRALEKNGILTASEEEGRAAFDADPDYFNGEPFENVSDAAANVVLRQKYEEYMRELAENARITVPDRDRMLEFTKSELES